MQQGRLSEYHQEYACHSPRDRHWSLLSITRFRTSGGLRLVIAHSDVTYRKRAQEQMLKAKHAAEAANRAKSEFLANMSHEIRTPLNGVLGMADLALGTGMTPEQREYLGTIKSAAGSLLEIVNHILDFSKIEARMLTLHHAEFDLREVVGRTVRDMAGRAHQKSLELALGISAEVPEIVAGDAGRLRQVLVNLIANATKFTERGEIIVRVEQWEPLASIRRFTFPSAIRESGLRLPIARPSSNPSPKWIPPPPAPLAVPDWDWRSCLN